MNTNEIKKALKKWNTLAISRIALTDNYVEDEYESYFDYIWYSSLVEVDIYREHPENSDLNKRSFNGTMKWLKDYQALTTEFKESRI